MELNEIQKAFVAAAEEVFGVENIEPEHLFFENQLTSVGRFLSHFVCKTRPVNAASVELKITPQQCPAHNWPYIAEYVYKTCKDSIVVADSVDTAFENCLRIIIIGGKYADAAVILEPKGLAEKILADYLESIKR